MTVAKPSNLRLCKEMLIGGRAAPGEGKPLDVWNPATGRIMGSLQQASAAQVEAAIAAARDAFDNGPWRRMSGAERSAAMHRIADQIEARRDEMVAAIVSEAGTPVSTAEGAAVRRADAHPALERRRGGAQPPRRARGGLRYPAQLQLHRLRAGRCGRRDRRLQLFAGSGAAEDRRGVGRRLHDSGDAVAAHALRDPAAGPINCSGFR